MVQFISLQHQDHPHQLVYAELGPAPEGLPSKPPASEPSHQYSTVLPHTKTSVECMYKYSVINLERSKNRQAENRTLTFSCSHQ